MPLLRKFAFVAMVTAAIGCHDTSGPRPVSTNYVLTKVNGVSLPAPSSPIPENPTVFAGSLYLDGAGHATITEQRREMSGNLLTLASKWKYAILGNTIRLESEQPCPANAICAAPPSGVFSNSHLLIDFSFGQGLSVYDYEFYGLD